MRKQYILIDTGTSSLHTIHTALVYAEAAQISGLADIKLVFTPMLFAEKEVSNKTRRRHEDKIRKANGEDIPQRNSNKPNRSSIYSLIERYNDYVEVAPFGETESKLRDMLSNKLRHLDKKNAKRLHKALGSEEPIETFLSPDYIAAHISDPEFFAKAYEICHRNKNFRDRLSSKGLESDLADHSITEWYDSLGENDRDCDVMLLSRDGKLIDNMRALHNAKHPESAKALEHFEYFSLTGFAQHVLSDVDEMSNIADRKPVSSEGRKLDAAIERCKAMSEWTLANKKGGGSLRNEHLVSSRLR